MTNATESILDRPLGVSASNAESDTISIAEILDSYGNWGVPHFQRGSVWSSDNTSALLESLYYDTPCGSIILWTPAEIDRHGVPFIKDRACSHLIIDGQQRTRSVYAAFKDLFDTSQDTMPETEGEQNSASAEGAKHWAINLNEVAEFDNLLHRPEKRLWPMFVPVPDPYRAEQNRLKRIQQGREKKKSTRYYIPESPFKYNFIPLHYFTNGHQVASALKEGKLFLKRAGDEPAWTNDDEFAALMARLEQVRLRIREMKTRRLFCKVLGKEVTLDAALRVFVRINSGGRPVEEEEKGFSVLVGRCPSTSDWVRTIFNAVHSPSVPQNPSDRNEALQRMGEKNFGFKLFIRIFMLAASYHTSRAIGGRSLAFSALQDRRFLPMIQDSRTYDHLWSTTSDVVISTRRLLESCLKLDALQFLPETTALFPLFLFLVKYPTVLESNGTQDVKVKGTFEPGVGKLALLLLLRDLGKQESLTWANDIAKSHEDASVLIERLQKKAIITSDFLEKRLRDANSLTNRYTLLLYALQRRLEARDFNYAVNELTGDDFKQPEYQLAGACDPEKQHIVPYSHLIRAYNLEFASRVSSTEANNVGNITYISHDENSLDGLSDRLVELGAESGENLRAHFITVSRTQYEEVRALIEGPAEAEVQPEQLREMYTAWIQSRRGEISKGFLDWLEDLQQEWLAGQAERVTNERVEPVPPIFRDPNDAPARAYALRTLTLADSVEDALIEIFLAEGWRIQNAKTWQVGEQLVFALERKRRLVVKNVRVSRERLMVPAALPELPQVIEFTGHELAVRQLNSLKEYLQRCGPLKPEKGGGPNPPGKQPPRPPKVTRDELLAVLRDLGKQADDFASFVDEVSSLGVYPELTKESVALRLPDPGGSAQQFRICRVHRTGIVKIGLLRTQLHDTGYSTEPALKQARTIARWLSDATVDADGALIGPDGRRNAVPLTLLMTDRRQDYAKVVRELVDAIGKAAQDASTLRATLPVS